MEENKDIIKVVHICTWNEDDAIYLYQGFLEKRFGIDDIVKVSLKYAECDGSRSETIKAGDYDEIYESSDGKHYVLFSNIDSEKDAFCDIFEKDE